MRVVNLGLQDFQSVYEQMRLFTQTRTTAQEDELWLVEHPPIYTQGLAGKPEHLLYAGGIEVVRIDRGGQITYHAPGQAVMYVLLDVKRKDIGVRALVTLLENSLIELLSTYQIEAFARADAPGVYVQGGAKIASLGLKISKGCSYHGLALNVDMDLSPFLNINPCGMAGLKMTQMRDLTSQPLSVATVQAQLAEIFQHKWL